MAGTLARQRVGERLACRAVLGSDDQIDVSDLVALPHEGLTDCKRTDGHDRLLKVKILGDICRTDRQVRNRRERRTRNRPVPGDLTHPEQTTLALA